MWIYESNCLRLLHAKKECGRSLWLRPSSHASPGTGSGPQKGVVVVVVPPLYFVLKKKKKTHLGSAIGFREMVPKPGPSKPGAQKGTRYSNQSIVTAYWFTSISLRSPLYPLSSEHLPRCAHLGDGSQLLPPIPKWEGGENNLKLTPRGEQKERGRPPRACVFCGAEVADTHCVSGIAAVYWVPGTVLSTFRVLP